MKIREHGIQSREHLRMETEKPKCQAVGKSFGSVRLIDCFSAVLIFVYGLIASILVLGMETFVKSRLCKVYVLRTVE